MGVGGEGVIKKKKAGVSSKQASVGIEKCVNRPKKLAAMSTDPRN